MYYNLSRMPIMYTLHVFPIRLQTPQQHIQDEVT